MKKIRTVVVGLTFAVVVLSCGHEKKISLYDDHDYVEPEENELADSEEKTRDESSLDYSRQDSEAVVPFRNEDGVKYVRVSVNGVEFDMIFDTGSSVTLISVAEANYLYQKGKLTQDDFLGAIPVQIADGSVVENMVVNLKDVVIDGQIYCPDVQATVSSNINAPLLLGNEILDRVAAITIDNETETLHFRLK